MDRIDNLDKKILNIIMKNARIASKDVAVECGVSRAAIHQRIQRLIEMKVITGSGYNVNPKTLGYNTCTYIGVSLEKGSMYRDVVRELEKIPEVVGAITPRAPTPCSLRSMRKTTSISWSCSTTRFSTFRESPRLKPSSLSNRA